RSCSFWKVNQPYSSHCFTQRRTTGSGRNSRPPLGRGWFVAIVFYRFTGIEPVPDTADPVEHGNDERISSDNAKNSVVVQVLDDDEQSRGDESDDAGNQMVACRGKGFTPTERPQFCDPRDA